jgi:hypothetical protein
MDKYLTQKGIRVGKLDIPQDRHFEAQCVGGVLGNPHIAKVVPAVSSSLRNSGDFYRKRK